MDSLNPSKNKNLVPDLLAGSITGVANVPDAMASAILGDEDIFSATEMVHQSLDAAVAASSDWLSRGG